ncbi:MAG: O-antigen ligase family protein [Actinobacteria bacterium]|nr:O-antigen ligase family protein [Actinomycetota bacterium]
MISPENNLQLKTKYLFGGENYLTDNKKISRYQKVMSFIAPLPAMFLLVNNYPILMLLAVFLVMSCSFLFLILDWKITDFHSKILFILILLYSYFIFSFFATGQSLFTFISYNFIKYDGNFFFCYILFFALSTPFFDYERASRNYFKYIFITFAVFGILGIFEYVLGSTTIMNKMDPGAGKMFVGLNFAHNATGSVYAVASIFMIIFFLAEKRKNLKFYYLLITLILVAALFLTKSRGSYIGFIVGTVCALWFHYKNFKKFIIRAAVLTGVLIPLIFITGTYKRVSEIFTTTDTAVIRSKLWLQAWQLFVKSPIFGVGFGRFNDIDLSVNYKLNGINGLLSVFTGSNIRLDAAHAHNSYLQFLSETGLVGLGFLILFWGMCFGILIRAYYSKEASAFARKVYLCGATSIITIFTLAFTENYLSATTIILCVSMLVSFGIGLYWQELRLKSNQAF